MLCRDRRYGLIARKTDSGTEGEEKKKGIFGRVKALGGMTVDGFIQFLGHMGKVEDRKETR